MRLSSLVGVFALLLPGGLFASVDPALLALIPSDAKLIAGMDTDRARSSSFGQYLLSRANNGDPHLQEFIDQTGVDPRRDLQSMVIAGNMQGNGHFAVIARGIFDGDRITAAAKAHGATVQTYAGADLYINPKDRSSAGFAFLDNTTIALADVATLKQILDNRNTASGLNPALQAQAAQVNAANDVWFVTGFPPTFPGLSSPGHPEGNSPAAISLQSVVRSSGGVRFGDLVQVSFDALTRSPQDATSLSDVLRFLASAVQMQRHQDPRAAILAGSLDSMALTSNGSSVHASLAVPEANLEQLLEMGPSAKRTAQLRPVPHRQWLLQSSLETKDGVSAK